MKETAIITGASRGIGRAIAEKFAADYNLALISRHYDDVNKFADELSKTSQASRFLPFECDVRNSMQIESVFQDIYEKFGSIDVLVNNAGVNTRRTISLDDIEKDFAGWNDEIATNLTGTYVCSYIAAMYMKRKNSGGIINISSIKGKEPTTSPGYEASKAGVIKLTRDFAKALAPRIRVNCIAPGFIDTGMTKELAEEKKKAYFRQIPLQRFGTVEEIARAARFLASDESSYITGACIDVNGGYLMS